MSQRLFAFSWGWSLSQIKRIEAAEVAPRFLPTWNLCFMMQINPLWLAFGETYSRYGCVDFPVFDLHPELGPEMPFADVMRAIGDEYIRASSEEKVDVFWPPIPQVFNFRASLAELTAKFAERIPPGDQPRFMAYLAVCADRFRAGRAISNRAVDKTLDIQNRWIFMADSKQGHWQQLREIVQATTAQRGARAQLARSLGVSPQALNEWLQGRSAPPAEQTLRLLRWVEQQAAQPQKQSARTSAEARAPKTQKGKTNRNAKSKSDQKKS